MKPGSHKRLRAESNEDVTMLIKILVLISPDIHDILFIIIMLIRTPLLQLNFLMEFTLMTSKYILLLSMRQVVDTLSLRDF